MEVAFALIQHARGDVQHGDLVAGLREARAVLAATAAGVQHAPGRAGRGQHLRHGRPGELLVGDPEQLVRRLGVLAVVVRRRHLVVAAADVLRRAAALAVLMTGSLRRVQYVKETFERIRRSCAPLKGWSE